MPRIRKISPLYFLCFIIYIFVLLPVSLSAEASSVRQGCISGVIDGDSIMVEFSDKKQVIRLYGVDCPEYDQPYGKNARDFSARWINRQVKVYPRVIDSYGRTVATVIDINDNDLGLELIKAGLAWWYKRYASDLIEYKKAQSIAKSKKKGLWKKNNPVPPWIWRYRTDN